MRTAGITVGVLAAVCLLAVVVEHGTGLYFRVADYWARRRETAAERTV